MPTTTPLNVLDELYLHLDREEEPWTVHVEIRVDGAIEFVALEAAVREAAARHPIARAQLAPSRGIDLHYEWLIAEQLGDIDLREVTCRDTDELDRSRERCSTAVPVTRPARAVLPAARPHRRWRRDRAQPAPRRRGRAVRAPAPGIDRARLCAGGRSSSPPVDPLKVRDVAALAAPDSVKERLERGRAGLDYLARGVATPTRIAPVRSR